MPDLGGEHRVLDEKGATEGDTEEGPREGDANDRVDAKNWGSVGTKCIALRKKRKE